MQITKRILTIVLMLSLVLTLKSCANYQQDESSDTAQMPVFSETTKESKTLEAEKIIAVPLVRQGHDYTCGVACTESILRYTGYDFDIREDMLAELLEADEETGTALDAIAQFLNKVRYEDELSARVQTEVREDMTIEELKECIDQGMPVICLIQAWSKDSEGSYDLQHDYADSWDSGHFVIAVGYNNEYLIFMDPSTAGNYTYISIATFIDRWHDIDKERGVCTQTGLIVDVHDPEFNTEEYYALM